ncbi:zinc finger protein Xfin-like isoform X1 [Leguminivora glycinivorella]|uniref:zinc finger protein Xfin-like isoform X1 n=3 Tax=Leguminivora glycinivorella TaxID=1035111 RepID=UPI0020105436|nr:zinc finger protein Xfin-like isoform X1 [Leguminivora glycinivorella]
MCRSRSAARVTPSRTARLPPHFNRHTIIMFQRTMLQQMSSPPSVHVGEVASLVRLEGRVCGDASSEASSDAAEDFELPQCKIRRNYNCTKCTFYTQNPRVYLVHTRDVHFERFKIYDCPHCVYASRHHQKLVRHIKMVHAAPSQVVKADLEPPPAPVATTTAEPEERIEDLLEEVEDTEEIQLDLEDCIEESMDHSADMEVEVDRAVAEEPSDLPKDKTKFFSCTKCNYVTHIRARFTKHVKYHSMPMIKCTMCDFRTPYKWNLDRHMKNHGGTGSFNCSMCNFTADIKQSLTVHEMNHHTPPVGQSVASRRRNRVGASDIALADAARALIVKEEEGSGDSRSSHASEMGLQYADIEMVTCTSDNETSTESTAKKDTELAQDTQQRQSPNSTMGEWKTNKQSRKIPRPIPQLIPLNTSTPNQNKSPPGEPPLKKFKEDPSRDTNIVDNVDNLPADITIIPVTNGTPLATKEPAMKKKNESFFDRLKERLLTATGEEGTLTCKNCGFESKCLSEHSVHEKNCTVSANRVLANNTHTSLGSTRCQNCRHRCKSSADLYVHMQTCGKVYKEGNEHSNDSEIRHEATSSIHETDIAKDEPHPMENVVFVWNNINPDTAKFETPLDININDDSTMPETSKNYDSEIVDENEGMNLSPSQAAGKKVFKCPHCTFWASTASRFHVHIVGHLNKKPFECSLCKYKSNWRWDITKHIKLKSARDPEHNDAKVLMTDETGRRNYSKYNKFLAVPVVNEYGETEFDYIDPNALANGSMELDESFNDTNDNINTTLEMQPLNLQTLHGQHSMETIDIKNEDQKPKKTMWKCKKCNYKDPSKEALLAHVREHSKPEDGSEEKSFAKKPENTPDPADLAYRCGHCNQLSNWKHVIQRHCRLKHDGVIKVITTVKPKPDASLLNEMNDTCTKCPFKATDRKQLQNHMQQHQPSPQSIFKCYFCPYFVKTEHDLLQHLALHGVTDPEEYISKAMGCKSPLPDNPGNSSGSTSTKRHKCTECPYETNSKSQFMYHEQFHRLPADTPYKCQECNYSVSKRHLLHQHMRVHGIMPKKTEMELEMEASSSSCKMEIPIDLSEIPFVWVSAKNEFHKMYKCRYCSYVNSQKCKIPNHEKIHCIVFENSEITIYKCLECKFTCDNAGRLAEHSRTHGEIYGRIYCPVETDVPDEEQIAKLRKVIESEKINNPDSPRDDMVPKDNEELKILFFCHKCPARFFIDSDLRIHDKFHDLLFTNKCKLCEFSVPQETELNAHAVHHSDEYATETKMLKFKHRSHPAHKEPKLEVVHCPLTSEVNWIVTHPSTNFEIVDSSKKGNENRVPKQYFCKECPAKFFKTSALSYHVGLHGGDGDHKCKKCSYTVKNLGNLAKHESLHENEGKTNTCDYESGEDNDYKNIPLSGTDLFQRKTEAQKRVVKDNNKLVKPNDHFPPVLQADPQFGYLMHGNPEFIYPTYMKNGRQKEKRYKCHKCPSAFEKREQYKIHLSLHGSKQRYKCEVCDYSVKYYANYVQHMRKHQMNDEAQAERRKTSEETNEAENETQEDKPAKGNIKLAIKTMPKGPTRPKSDFQQFSVSDQQTLRLLQLRRSINNAEKEKQPDPSPAKERKLHMCLLCPYTNQRQDALTNHYKRHEDNLNAANGIHKCPHCDLVVVQSHFLREHLKTHFNYQKHLTPECYAASEGLSFVIKQLDDEEDTKHEDKSENINEDVTDTDVKCEKDDLTDNKKVEESKTCDLKDIIKNGQKNGPKLNIKVAVKEQSSTDLVITLDEKITFDSNDNKIFVKLKTGELIVE